jgi:hypothetical protein
MRHPRMARLEPRPDVYVGCIWTHEDVMFLDSCKRAVQSCTQACALYPGCPVEASCWVAYYPHTIILVSRIDCSSVRH